jgi:hypothetical protein
MVKHNKNKCYYCDNINYEYMILLCNECEKNKITSAKKIISLYKSLNSKPDFSDKRQVYKKNSKLIYYLNEDFELIDKIKSINDLEIEREKIIREEFILNKLKFIKNRDVMEYIKYGTPTLDEVIINIAKLECDKTDNYINLIKELDKKKIKYNENLKSFKSYINGYTTCSLEETLNNIEYEYILNYETNYHELQKIMNDEEAEYNAMFEYGRKLEKSDENIDEKSNECSYEL